MTYDKNDTHRIYQGNRHKGAEAELFGGDTPIGDQVHQQKKVQTRLPFIDRIKVLLRVPISGKDLVMNRIRRYEVEMLPSPTQRESQYSPLSKVHVITPRVTLAALLVSGKADRLWMVDQKSGRDVEYTHSNLG